MKTHCGFYYDSKTKQNYKQMLFQYTLKAATSRAVKHKMLKLQEIESNKWNEMEKRNGISKTPQLQAWSLN